MILKKGDIFKDFHGLDYVGITTNSVLNKNGELVMGAGIAKTAKQHNKHLPILFGSQIKAKECEGGFYGILIQGKYFAFQTKRNLRDNSLMEDIVWSISMLKRGCEKYPDKKFGLPFPAINNGGLNWRNVIKYLEDLPDNCIVYHLGDLE